MPKPFFGNHDYAIYGVDELVRKINSLPDKLRDKGLRQAVSAGATPVVKATKAAMQTERTGLLRQSIMKIVLKSYKQHAGYVAMIGARRMTGIKKKGIEGMRFIGKKVRTRILAAGLTSVYPTRYLHLYEKGTSHSRAFTPLARGLAASKDQAFGIMRTKLTEWLAQEAGK